MKITDRQNLTVGNGKAFFAPVKSDGTFEGERYVGFVESFGISVESQRIEKYASNCGAREKVRDIVTQTDRNGTLVLSDISADNAKMFLQGEIAEHTQNTTPVTDETHAGVVQGRYYYAGASASSPIGVGEVSTISVTAPAGAVADVDYTVDLAHGRIYVIPGGTKITTGVEMKIGYTPVAKKYTRVNSGTNAVRGRFRVEACNLDGLNRDTIIPMIDLAPSGDFSPIGDEEYMTLTFDGRINKLEGVPAIILNGVEI